MASGSSTDLVKSAPRGDAAAAAAAPPAFQFGGGGSNKSPGFLKNLAKHGGKAAQIWGTATGNKMLSGAGSLANSYGSDTDINMPVVAAGLKSSFDTYGSPSPSASGPLSMAAGTDDLFSGFSL